MSSTNTPLNTTSIDGNNVSESHGLFPQTDGTFDALTLSKGKNFKTRRGAERWLARNYSSKYGHLA